MPSFPLVPGAAQLYLDASNEVTLKIDWVRGNSDILYILPDQNLAPKGSYAPADTASSFLLYDDGSVAQFRQIFPNGDFTLMSFAPAAPGTGTNFGPDNAFRHGALETSETLAGGILKRQTFSGDNLTSYSIKELPTPSKPSANFEFSGTYTNGLSTIALKSLATNGATIQNSKAGFIDSLVKLDPAYLIGNDGSTLIGNDGSTLIGNDGSTLIGNDGSTLRGLSIASLIGNDGSTLIGNDGSTLIGNDGSTMVAAGGLNLVAAGGLNLVAAGGGNLVAAGGGNIAAGVGATFAINAMSSFRGYKLYSTDSFAPHTGDAGDNALTGGAGNDVLRGGLGADGIISGDGDDLMLGADSDFIRNGRFETILPLTFDAGGYAYTQRLDGWRMLSGQGIEIFTKGAAGAPSEGRYGVDLEGRQANTNLTLSQVVTGLTKGEGYVLAFDVRKAAGVAADAQFEVYWGGQRKGLPGGGEFYNPGTNWETIRIFLEGGAGAGDDKNRLTFKETGGGDAYGTLLDNVRMYRYDGKDLTGRDPALDGNDAFAAGGGADTVFGHGGDDSAIFNTVEITKIAGGLKQHFSGGAGTDLLVMDWSAASTPIRWNGLETGKVPNISLAIGQAESYVRAGAGTDTGQTLYFNEVERFVLSGGSGKDLLKGGSLADSLSGGAADDTLIGGGGADTLDGGDGFDLAILNLPRDVRATINIANILANGGNATLSNGTVLRSIEAIELVGTDQVDTLKTGGTIAKAGPEFNPPSSNNFGQRYGTVAALTDGRFAVAWVGDGAFAGDPGGSARVRIFAADGSPSGPDILVNAPTTGTPSDPAIAAMAGGRFVISWTEPNPLDGDPSDSSIRARIFNADGSQYGSEFRVNTTTQSGQLESSVDVLNDGHIVVAWTDTSREANSAFGRDVRARIFNADGSVAVSEFLVNTTIPLNQYDPKVTALADGRFAITWLTDGVNTPYEQPGVKGRTFNADGTVYAGEFYANALNNRPVYKHDAMALADGRFTITFAENPDTGGQSLVARVLNGDGTASVEQFPVLPGTEPTQRNPAIAELKDGRFVITWEYEKPGQTFESGIKARVFNADGTESGPAFLVADAMKSNGALDPNVSALENGNFIITWQSGNDGGDISAQIFNPLAVEGTTGGDLLTGGRLADRLAGGKGADSLVGLEGNDELIGDGAVSLSSAAKSVERLYIATLDRGPDDGGWKGWSAELSKAVNGILDIVNGFVSSQEFQTKYGALDNTGFVTKIYNNVLDRAPDAGGLAAFVGALDAGSLSRTQLVANFSESQEFKDAVSTERHAGQIYRLYGGTLGRAPDSAGLEGWTDQMGGGRGLVDIALGFVNSQEFQIKYGALDNAGFVSLLYQNVLGRAPDQAGLDGWLALMSGPNALSRTQVVTGFSESLEYINGTRAATNAYIRTVMTDWSDTLVGGVGDDKLTGGRGADRYVFAKSDGGNDIVYGFDAFDTLELNGFGFSTPAQALAAMSQQGGNVIFSYQGGSITFEDTQLSTLQGLSAEGWILG